jgi:hypothetical protein
MDTFQNRYSVLLKEVNEVFGKTSISNLERKRLYSIAEILLLDIDEYCEKEGKSNDANSRESLISDLNSLTKAFNLIPIQRKTEWYTIIDTVRLKYL